MATGLGLGLLLLLLTHRRGERRGRRREHLRPEQAGHRAVRRQPLHGRQRGRAMTPAQRSDQLRDEFMGRQARQGAIRLALGARSPQGVEQVYGFHSIRL